MKASIAKIVDWLVKHIKGYSIKEEKTEEDVEDAIGEFARYIRGPVEPPEKYCIKTLNLLIECARESDITKRVRMLTIGYTGLYTEVDVEKFNKLYDDIIERNIESIVMINVRHTWDMYITGIRMYICKKIITPNSEYLPSCVHDKSITIKELRDTCAEHRPDLVEEIDAYIDRIIRTTVTLDNRFYVDFDIGGTGTADHTWLEVSF